MKISCNHHVASFVPEDAGRETPRLSNVGLGLAGEYTFTYDYPLTTSAAFTHVMKLSDSVVDILVMARADYEAIYKTEHEAVEDPGMVSGTLNRDRSSGPYGIWGHVLSDLYFEAVTVIVEKKVISFSIGS